MCLHELIQIFIECGGGVGGCGEGGKEELGWNCSGNVIIGAHANISTNIRMLV